MAQPRPQKDMIELNGHSYAFKCYLQSKPFPYRCTKHYTHSCLYLLTVAIAESTYDPQSWRFISATGAYQASKLSHSKTCLNSNTKHLEQGTSPSTPDPKAIKVEQCYEWSSDVNVLKDYIRQNMTLKIKSDEFCILSTKA